MLTYVDPADFALEVNAAASRRGVPFTRNQSEALANLALSAVTKFDRFDAAKALPAPSVSPGLVGSVLEELSHAGSPVVGPSKLSDDKWFGPGYLE